MALRLKELSQQQDLLAGGHAACAGCTGPTVIRQALLAAGADVVCGCATGCMEVVTTIFPNTAWRTSFIHNAFENSAATISGAEAAYRVLRSKGKIDRDVKFIAFGGDGGTYDIGFQSLSGAMERGHNMLYICYDNEAYMNTGIQRSSATPKGAATMTTPSGKVKLGKERHRKDLTACIIAHNVPYVAQASPHNHRDLMRKVQRALEIEGPAFINTLAPCHRGWRFNMEDAIDIARLATETCFWPLFEVDHGEWTINYKPKEKRPLKDWIEKQGRFRHLMTPRGAELMEELQEETDRKWAELLAKEKANDSAE